jgi:hypothetical protein
MAQRMHTRASVDDRRKSIRERALRAACAMSVVASLSGCFQSHDRPDLYDAQTPPVADAGTCPTDVLACSVCGTTQQCCDALHGYFEPTSRCCSTCTVGPLVPPAAPV